MPFAEADRVFDGARVLVNTSRYEGFPKHSCRPGRAACRRWHSSTPARRDPDGPVYDIATDIESAPATSSAS
jgi:hypothetical protein